MANSSQEWRFIIQDARTSQFLDLDLPLSNVTVTQAIDAPGSITGTLPAKYPTILNESGELAISEFGTIIHAELDGVLIASCIIDSIEMDDESINIDAGGFSMLTKDIPWLGKAKSYILTDPLDVVRDIWTHVQSYPDGDLGIKVDETTSTVTIGTPDSKALVVAKANVVHAQARLTTETVKLNLAKTMLDTARKAVLSACGVSTAGAVFLQSSAVSGSNKKAGNVWIDKDNLKPYKLVKGIWKEVTGTTATGAANSYSGSVNHLSDQTALTKKVKEVLATAKSKVSDLSEGEAVPLKLNWWETNDLQSVIDELVASTPFNYLEHSYWGDDDEIHYELKLGYPKLGTRREQARFEVGINVKVVPTVMLGDYASEVIVYGAGEGSAKINARVTEDIGKLRRVHTETNQGLTTKARAENAARPILKNLIGKQEIDSLVVANTDLAPFGTYGVGDEIFVSGDVGWSDLYMWVRITEVSINPDNTEITLKVVTV